MNKKKIIIIVLYYINLIQYKSNEKTSSKLIIYVYVVKIHLIVCVNKCDEFIKTSKAVRRWKMAEMAVGLIAENDNNNTYSII